MSAEAWAGVGRGLQSSFLNRCMRAGVRAAPISAAEIPRISTPASQSDSEPNEAPHYARVHNRGHTLASRNFRRECYWRPVGKRSLQCGVCRWPTPGGALGVRPDAGHVKGASIPRPAAVRTERDCGDFCGYSTSKWRQLASNPAIGTYSSFVCKRLITSS